MVVVGFTGEGRDGGGGDGGGEEGRRERLLEGGWGFWRLRCLVGMWKEERSRRKE